MDKQNPYDIPMQGTEFPGCRSGAPPHSSSFIVAIKFFLRNTSSARVRPRA